MNKISNFEAYNYLDICILNLNDQLSYTMEEEFVCTDDSWNYSCLVFYPFSAIDYIVFTIMLLVSAIVGVRYKLVKNLDALVYS